MDPDNAFGLGRREAERTVSGHVWILDGIDVHAVLLPLRRNRPFWRGVYPVSHSSKGGRRIEQPHQIPRSGRAVWRASRLARLLWAYQTAAEGELHAGGSGPRSST